MTEMRAMEYKIIIPESLLEYIVDRSDAKELTELCGLFCQGKKWVKSKTNKKFQSAMS